MTALALLSLAACATTPKPSAPAAASGESARYRCADGRVIEVLYSGGDAAVLTLGNRDVAMTRAASANGERYVGEGLQWWGKGAREGMLSPLAPGEAVAAAPGVVCRVD